MALTDQLLSEPNEGNMVEYFKATGCIDTWPLLINCYLDLMRLIYGRVL